jgi:hypothetical protein
LLPWNVKKNQIGTKASTFVSVDSWNLLSSFVLHAHQLEAAIKEQHDSQANILKYGDRKKKKRKDPTIKT